MKSIFSRTTIVALTLWLGLAAGSANAVVTEVTLSGNYTTGYAGTFGQVVSGAFNSIYSFAMPVATSGGGASNTISLDNNRSFSFSAFNLYSAYNEVTNTLSGLISTGTFSTVAPLEIASLNFSSLAAPATYYLNVIGSATTTASYAGNINISPVPEPETYAMMLAGLGLIGFSARRRKS